VSSCTGSLAAGLGAIVAGTVLRLFEGQQWHVAGFTFVPFHILFAASFILRMTCALVLVGRVREPQNYAEPAEEPTGPAS
jgi:hypothetical protein